LNNFSRNYFVKFLRAHLNIAAVNTINVAPIRATTF